MLVLSAALLFGPSAGAHTKSTSYSRWTIEGADVHLTVTLPVLETARLAPAGGAQPSDERVASYLTPRLWVTAGGEDCPALQAPRALAATPQFRRFEWSFRCRSPAPPALHSSLFVDLVPSHVSLAEVELGGGRVMQQLFTRSAQTLETTADAGGLRQAGLGDYLRMGVMHIFTGVDHMSFLLGLVLISRRLRDLVFVVTGFTIGHSITLALAVSGVIRPHAQYIDALVALTIAMIGAENIAVAIHRPTLIGGCVGAVLLAMAAASALGLGGLPPLLLLGAGLFAANYLMLSGHIRDAARLRIVVTVVFGLIHGFGFAADLLQMQLPAGQLLRILFGFNLGVEVGQLSLVLGAVASVALLRRLALAPPRPIVVEILSAALVGLGVFWFVSRSYA